MLGQVPYTKLRNSYRNHSSPSEDDVLVLKNELVNAQKLMDEITKEKEVSNSTFLCFHPFEFSKKKEKEVRV